MVNEELKKRCERRLKRGLQEVVMEAKVRFYDRWETQLWRSFILGNKINGQAELVKVS